MKPIYLLSALFFFSLRAQAPTPVPLARGNTPGEPHHHLKIENSYVRAYYVEVPPHDATQLHQHDHDYIFVTLGDSDVTNAVLGKPEVHLQLKDGEVRFTRGGFAHVARNNSDAPFRNVTIEFLHPQSNLRNRCAVVVPNEPPTLLCHYPRPGAPIAHSSELFDTAELVADLHSLGPNVRAPGSRSKKARLLIFNNDSPIRVELSDKTSKTLQGGDLLWVDAGTRLKIANPNRKASSRYLSISFKHSPAPT